MYNHGYFRFRYQLIIIICSLYFVSDRVVSQEVPMKKINEKCIWLSS